MTRASVTVAAIGPYELTVILLLLLLLLLVAGLVVGGIVWLVKMLTK